MVSEIKAIWGRNASWPVISGCGWHVRQAESQVNLKYEIELLDWSWPETMLCPYDKNVLMVVANKQITL